MMNKWIYLFACAGLGSCFASAPPKPNTVLTTIQGKPGPALSNADKRIKMDLNALGKHPSPTDILHFYHTAPLEIKQAIKPYGYFHGQVSSTLSHNAAQHRWKIIYQLRLGPPAIITSLSLKIDQTGTLAPSLKPYFTSPPFKINAQLNTSTYTSFKESVLNKATQLGYFDASFSKDKILINLKSNQVKIILHLSTGPRFRFGQTRFISSYYSQQFLQRYLPYKKSDYYNADKITQLQKNLNNSVYFTDVSITPTPSATKQALVPITIKLKPSPKYQYEIGGGYGTDTRFRALFGIKIPHLTTSGAYLNLATRLSSVNSIAAVNYYLPGSNPVTDQYQFTAAYGTTTVGGLAKNIKLSASYHNIIYGLKQSISLTYLNENYRLTNEPRISTNLVMPGISWTRVVTDNTLHPTHGYLASLSLFGADTSFLSQDSFFQSDLKLKWLDTFTTHYRLLLRTHLAHTNISKLSQLPLSLQLFAGGAASIRGYAYQSIGPSRNLMTASIELQRQLFGQWYLAGFFDAGNAAPSPFKALKRGAGVGVLWLSPVGALELTAAKALDLPGKPWRIQFSMGPQL